MNIQETKIRTLYPYILSPETRLKMSLAKLGTKASDETREKMRISAGSQETHKNWKGDAVGYSGVHEWVKKWKGAPDICENCGTTTAKKYEWANKDHTYKRVLEDYIRMCTPCHRAYDRDVLKIKVGR